MPATARTRADLQDELRTVLDNWKNEIQELRRSSMGDLDPLARKVVAEVPPLLPAVRRAVERAPRGTESTLWLGLLMGTLANVSGLCASPA